MRTLITILVFALSSTFMMAQTGIKGKVSSSGVTLEDASVIVEGTSTSTITSKDGEYFLDDLKPGTYKIRAEFVGFKPQTKKITVTEGNINIVNFNLKEDTSLNEIVITGTLKPVLKSESVVPVEIYTPAFFKKNPTANLFEAVQLINGVQNQLNCNVCNTGDIHINGMEGPYTMILIDGMPIVSPLSTVYGLSGIPTSMIDRIEVVKGPASALYGTEAMGGIINVITKNPENAPILSLDAYTTSWLETNIDAGTKFKVGDKVSSMFGVNYFNYSHIMDQNKDNFTDVTLQDRISLFNKWSVKREEDRIANLAMRYVYEDRWGGETNWDKKKHRGGDEVYAESIFTNRFEAIAMYQLPTTEKIFTQFSYNYHNQDSKYGTEPFMAKQHIGFAQAYWDKDIENHSLLLGASFKYSDYDDDTRGTGDYDKDDNLIKNNPNLDPIPGIFVQDEWSFNKTNKLLLGYRFDYHKKHKGIHSPRLGYKFTPNPHHSIRASFGTGFRIVNVFTEDHKALTGNRSVKVAEELNPERSYNGNLNYVWKLPTDFGAFNFDAMAFYTYFTNKIDADLESEDKVIVYDNLDGHAVSQGISLNVDVAFDFPLKLMVGGTYMQVYRSEKQDDGTSEQEDILHAPRWSGTLLASYDFGNGFSADLTGDLKGPMHLVVVDNDYRPEMSPWVMLANVQLTKKFQSGFEMYGGIKNLLNTKPKVDPIARWWDPFERGLEDGAAAITPPTGRKDVAFDPNYSYTAMQGLRVFFGMRYTIF